MTKAERYDFDTAQSNYKVACAANQNMTLLYNKLIERANNLEKQNANQQQEIKNLTLERTALFQALWDLQKFRKQQDGKIAELESQPRVVGMMVFNPNVEQSTNSEAQ